MKNNRLHSQRLQIQKKANLLYHILKTLTDPPHLTTKNICNPFPTLFFFN